MGRSDSRSRSRTRDRKSESRDRRRRRSDSRDSSRSRSRRHRSRSRSHGRSASRRSGSRDRQQRDDSRDRDRGGFADRGGGFGARGRGRGRGRGGGGRGTGPWTHDQMAWNSSAAASWEMGMWPPGGPPGGAPPLPPMGWIPPPQHQGPPGHAHPPPMWPGPAGAVGFAHPPPHVGGPPRPQAPAVPHPAHQEQQMVYEMPQISALAAYAFDVPLCRDLMSDNGFQDAIQQMYPDYSIDSDQRIGGDVVSDVEDAGYESSDGENEDTNAEAKTAAETVEAKEQVDDDAAAVAADEGAEESEEKKPAKDSNDDDDDDDDDDEDLYGDIATDDIAPIETEHDEKPLGATPAIAPAVQHLDAQHSLISKMRLRAIGAPVTKEHKRAVRRHFHESLRFTQHNVEPATC